MFEGAIGNRGMLELIDADTEAELYYDATVESNRVTIHGPFHPGRRYSLRSSASALLDLAGNRALNMPLHPEIIEISDDTDGPEVELPMHGETQMHDTFSIRFDEAVLPGNSSIMLESMPPQYCGIGCGRHEVSSWSLTALWHVHFEENGGLRSLLQVVPERPLLPGFTYALVVPPELAIDTVGNVQSEGASRHYVAALQRDVTPPHLVAAMIDGRAAPTIFDQDASARGLELVFSESLQPLDTSASPLLLVPDNGGDRCSGNGACMPRRNCSFPCSFIPASRSVAIPAASLEMRGAVVSVDLAHLPSLEYGHGYRLHVLEDLFLDMAGNAGVSAERSGPAVLVFEVANSKDEAADDPEIVATFPADGELMVPQTSALQITFDRPIQVGSGDFVLVPTRELNGSVYGNRGQNASRSDEHQHDVDDENNSDDNQSTRMWGDDSSAGPMRPNFTAMAD
ncbi:unnamed protein product, partial [Symbiodinium necroappetens]